MSPDLLITVTLAWFSFLSAACRLRSSYISLAAVTHKMRKNGTMVTYLPVGLIPGICWRRPMLRKKMFA